MRYIDELITKTSPPTQLVVLTAVVLLLAAVTATANAATPSSDGWSEHCQRRMEQPLAGDELGAKWAYLAAVCDLAEITFGDFQQYLPEAGELRVEILSEWAVDYQGTWVRDAFDDSISAEVWESEILPLFRYLVVTDDGFERAEFIGPISPVECDDDGYCSQQIGDSEIMLQFTDDENDVRLIGVELFPYTLGC